MNTEQLKAANPIEQVAARYTTLYRAGSNYKILCPFHNDHHPSLMLHVGKQFFKCHACGAGGDVIKLVMGLEKCSFTEAVSIMSSETVTRPLPPPLSPDKKRKDTPDTKSSLSQNLQFKNLLLPYASGHSELSPTWLGFEVGLAPAFVPDAFKAMRSRLIFPIYDEKGLLTGFGARRIDNIPLDTAHTQSPKYINSANNGLFDKSRTLYGIHRAAEAIRREGFAFVVEGYKDVLAMHAAGFCNTVGLCGTALADGQADILSRHTTRLHLLLDGDRPGQDAAEKIATERKRLFSIHCTSIPGGEDPDELFRRLGKARFRTYLHHLTATSSLAARRLLGYCIRHPAMASLLEQMLEADDMRFADSDYTDLLHCQALQEEVPEELEVFASYLESLLPDLFPPLPDLPGVPEEMTEEGTRVVPEVMLRTLVTEYYEEKIICEARQLCRQVQSHSTEHRPTLLHNLHKQLYRLSQVTCEAKRTVAVDERWF